MAQGRSPLHAVCPGSPLKPNLLTIIDLQASTESGFLFDINQSHLHLVGKAHTVEHKQYLRFESEVIAAVCSIALSTRAFLSKDSKRFSPCSK